MLWILHVYLFLIKHGQMDAAFQCANAGENQTQTQTNLTGMISRNLLFLLVCKLTSPLTFLKTFSFRFRQKSVSILSTGMKARGQFLNKKSLSTFFMAEMQAGRMDS